MTGPTNPIGINVFKNRTYFWDDNSQTFWYSAVNTLGGVCTEYHLEWVGQFGGKLLMMVTWTRDGGSGPDDFAVFIMNSGEALVYQGTYPGGADWAIVGVYNIGEPLSIRSSAKFGGDFFVMTRHDYVSMSQVLQGPETQSQRTKVS